MRRAWIAVLIAGAAACHRSTPAVSPPAAAAAPLDAVVTQEPAAPFDDSGWEATLAQLEARDQGLDDGPFGLFHATHSLYMRGQILNKEVLRQLSHLNTGTSYYSHTTYVNEETGTRRVDCSGFVDYAVRRVLPEAYEKVPHPTSQRPLANDWYNYLRERYQSASTQESLRWREIRHVGELRSGDLVVWLRPQSVSGDNTGHIMFVLATPTRGRPGEWLVKVADSTTSPHANDTRGTTRTGPGSGTIGLTVDSWDRPLAYYWRGGLSYTAFSTPIAMGRVE
jgi:hypothetical protein